MIYIDSYDKELLRIIKKSPGISQFDLREIVGRPTPFRKRMKRLMDLGLIKQKTDDREAPQTAQKLYLNEKLYKEVILVKNENHNAGT